MSFYARTRLYLQCELISFANSHEHAKIKEIIKISFLGSLVVPPTKFLPHTKRIVMWIVLWVVMWIVMIVV